MAKKAIHLHKGVKATLAFFIASLVTKGISFIATPIFTRLMTAEEFGKVSVYYTWSQIFGIIAMFCLSYGVFNVGLLENPKKRNEFSFSLLILSNIITISFSAVLFCLYPIINSFLNIDLIFLILMMVSFLFQPAYNFWLVRQRFEYKYKWTFFWSCISALLSLTVPAILIVLNKTGDGNLYYRIFGAEIVLIAIHIGFYIYLAVSSKFKINVHYWKSVLLFNLPLIPHYLSSYLLNSSDKIMISYLISDEATAYYSVAYSIASIALIIWSAVDSSFLPYTFQKLKEQQFDSIKKVSIPVLLVFAVGCFIVILLAPEAVMIMGSKGYEEAVYVIPPIVGGVFFQVQYFLYSNILYYYKRTKSVMFGSVTAAALNIVLNFIFIRRFGYIAAGYTTLGCYLVQALIDYLAMRTAIKEDIYNWKFILVLSSVVLCVSIFSSYLYAYRYIRYGIILLVLILLGIFSKKIIKLFVSLKKSEE